MLLSTIHTIWRLILGGTIILEVTELQTVVTLFIMTPVRNSTTAAEDKQLGIAMFKNECASVVLVKPLWQQLQKIHIFYNTQFQDMSPSQPWF